MFCTQCGAEIPDGSTICPVCSAQLEQSQNTQASQPQEGAQQVPPQANQVPPQSFQIPPQQPNFQQNMMNQDTIEKGNKAKTLGIVGIIVGLFVPLVGWICGGIGKGNANKAFMMTNDPQFKSNRSLCTAAIIVSTISFILAIVYRFVIMGVTTAYY